MRIQREYHATTLLLPDGRVLTTAGAGSPALPSPDDGIDVYDPPYLFRGPRPSIDAISATNFAQGDTFQLDVSLAPAVTAVVMIGAQATTHYIDGAVPRRLALAFEQTGGRLDVRAPASAIAAPEGFYNVFVMVDDVPSEGVLVRLDPAAGPIPPDQIGNALRAIKALEMTPTSYGARDRSIRRATTCIARPVSRTWRRRWRPSDRSVRRRHSTTRSGPTSAR